MISSSHTNTSTTLTTASCSEDVHVCSGGLPCVSRLAEQYETSFEATAIQYVKTSPYLPLRSVSRRASLRPRCH